MNNLSDKAKEAINKRFELLPDGKYKYTPRKDKGLEIGNMLEQTFGPLAELVKKIQNIKTGQIVMGCWSGERGTVTNITDNAITIKWNDLNTPAVYDKRLDEGCFNYIDIIQ